MIRELIDILIYRLALASSRMAREEIARLRFYLDEAYKDLDYMGRRVDELAAYIPGLPEDACLDIVQENTEAERV